MNRAERRAITRCPCSIGPDPHMFSWHDQGALYTRAELEQALAVVNLWVHHPGSPDVAHRGRPLHHLDVANDILLIIERQRDDRNRLAGPAAIDQPG